MEYQPNHDDLQSLLNILPPEVNAALEALQRYDDLLEVILDLGRRPTARLTDGEVRLLERSVGLDDIETVLLQIRNFDADNRAGIERTLHRISAIRNRSGAVVGLTCRVGRAVFGTIDIIEDIVTSGKSILLLGKPGVGKTTMLREAARVLAETKRVVIVDTSNEIGGDGDIPHPAVGQSRRMQVAQPSLQHEVMIEAVENHNPEVIIIDEIGRELEAVAARTIAERGVQLIGTAHGITLENLLLNPTLSDLVGGIESVTLSDEEARRRGTQKTILERRAPPTFDVLIEIQDRNTLAAHNDVLASVDTLLRGRPLAPEIRSRDPEGQIRIEAAPEAHTDADNGHRRRGDGRRKNTGGRFEQGHAVPEEKPASSRKRHVLPYGIARNRLNDTAKRLHLPLEIVDHLDDAEVLVTLKNIYRRRPRPVAEAELRRMPIYVLRANTPTQIEDFLVDLFNLKEPPAEPFEDAMQETQAAIEQVRNGEKRVDLSPRATHVRRRQHEMVREAKLISHSYGKGAQRHVRIYRE
jgi:stage III sporulation protein SpoIIIAA